MINMYGLVKQEAHLEYLKTKQVKDLQEEQELIYISKKK